MTWTLVELKSTTATATASLTSVSTAIAEGDVVVVMAEGTTANLPLTGTPVVPWTKVTSTRINALTIVDYEDGSGGGRVVAWYKRLVDADLSIVGSLQSLTIEMADWPGTGTVRWQIAVVRETDGFDDNPLVGTVVKHNDNVGTGTQSIGSVSGGTRKLCAFALWGGNGQSGLQFIWDGDSAKIPYFDDPNNGTDPDGPNNGTNHFGTNSTSCQADFKTYDTAETVDLSASVGMNNTTHCAMLFVIQTRDSALSRTSTDAVGVTDSVTRAAAYVRTITDPVGVTDSVSTGAQAHVRTITDPVGITDFIPVAHVRTITDSIGIQDTGQVVLGAPDFVNITDEVIPESGLALVHSDPIGLTDSLAVAQVAVRTFAETVGISDSVGVAAVTERSFSDSIGISDSVSVVFSAAGASQTLVDSVGITDSILVLPGVSRPVSDAVGITDSLLVIHVPEGAGAGYGFVMRDTVGITDEVIVSLRTLLRLPLTADPAVSSKTEAVEVVDGTTSAEAVE